MLITDANLAWMRRLLSKIGPYANHMSDCAHWCEQTSEYCDCGLSDARAAYRRLFELLTPVAPIVPKIAPAGKNGGEE